MRWREDSSSWRYVNDVDSRRTWRYDNVNAPLMTSSHKAGIRANRYVQPFGLRLLPEIYEAYNPVSYDAALDMKSSLRSTCAKVGTACDRLDMRR